MAAENNRPTRTPRLEAEERRTQIMEAALAVFTEKGLAAARTREIAARAGISEALIYRHFKSKDDLYQAAVRSLTEHHPLEPDLMEPMAAGDDEAVLRAVAEHVLGHGRQDPRLATMAVRAALEKPVCRVVAESHSGHRPPRELLVDYLRERATAGAIDCPNPELTARLFVQMLFLNVADIHLSITGPPLEVDDTEAAREMARLFVRGLRPRRD